MIRFLHPLLCSREEEIDAILARARDQVRVEQTDPEPGEDRADRPGTR